jgi:Tetratricopeptide repeat
VYNVFVEEFGEPGRIATGLRTLGYTERLRGRLSDARRLLERSIEIAEQSGDPDHAARGLALLGAILHDLGEIGAAAERFARVRELGDLPMARRGLWEAEHHLALGWRDAVIESTRRNLEACARRGWEGHVAHCHAVLGLAALDRDPAAAEAHLRAARAWAETTGELEMVLRCRELAARLALARGELEAGLREALEALPARASRGALHPPRCPGARGGRALGASGGTNCWKDGRCASCPRAGKASVGGGRGQCHSSTRRVPTKNVFFLLQDAFGRALVASPGLLTRRSPQGFSPGDR